MRQLELVLAATIILIGTTFMAMAAKGDTAVVMLMTTEDGTIYTEGTDHEFIVFSDIDRCWAYVEWLKQQERPENEVLLPCLLTDKERAWP